MYYLLHDASTEEMLGTVKVTNTKASICLQNVNPFDELYHNWKEFNQHQGNTDTDEFVIWNNQKSFIQIESIFVEFIQC